MYEKQLTDAGLTRNEARVYLALLNIGKAQSGKIVQEAKISGGKVYETLYKLIDKGIVEVVIENGVKQFHAADPKSILLYMEERKNKVLQETATLAKIIPDLEKIKEFQEPAENVYLIKGFRGIAPLVTNTLEKAWRGAYYGGAVV